MRSALLLVVAAVCAGCPSGDDDSGDPASYVPLDEITGAYKGAYCTFLARCGVFPDRETCVGASLAVVPTIDANVVAAVRAGRALYNGANVKTCFDAVANDTCDQTDENGRARTPACSAFFRGTVADGGECLVDQECISQQCAGGDTQTSCVRGTCLGDAPPNNTPLALGMPCTSTPACVDGAYCDTGTNVCTRLKASGEPCTGSTECGYGLACAGPTGERVCRPLPALGEPCDLQVPCRDEGQLCDGVTATCKAVGLPGAACTSSMECSPYYRCDTGTATCVKGPSRGEPCSGRCFEAATYCDAGSLVCVDAAADGAPCTGDLECASEHCDFNVSPSVCSPPPVCP